MTREAIADLPRMADREAALTELLRTAAPRGLRIATRLCGAADAEDAVQEALAKTYRDFARVREPEAWFIRVLVNHCLRLSQRRRLLRWRRPEPPVVAAPADEQLGRARALAQLRAEVDRLPPMQRAAVLLRFGEEMSIAEVAGALAIGEETVKTHLARALERLRREIR